MLRVAAVSQTRQLVSEEAWRIASVPMIWAGLRRALAARVLKPRFRRTAPHVLPIALIVWLTPMQIVLDSTSSAEGEGSLSNNEGQTHAYLKLIGASENIFPRPASHLQHPEARRVLRDSGGWRWGIGRVRSVHELHHRTICSCCLWQCGEWLSSFARFQGHFLFH